MKQIKVMCDCGGELYVTEEDFGGEIECCRCGSDMWIPETEEAILQHNFETEKTHENMHFTGKVRIMIRDECGQEKCVIDEASQDNLEWIIKGVEASYPEAHVYTERVENQRYLAEQFMLDDNF